MSLARLSADLSSRNAFASAAVGNRPIASSEARRKKSASVANADGSKPSRANCACASSSMKLFFGSAAYCAAGIFFSAGTVMRAMATCPMYRAITVPSPFTRPTVTRPALSTAAISPSLETKSARSVTSRRLPSEYRACTISRCDWSRRYSRTVGVTATDSNTGSSSRW